MDLVHQKQAFKIQRDDVLRTKLGIEASKSYSTVLFNQIRFG